MRIYELSQLFKQPTALEAKASQTQPVSWPTNLAWKINFKQFKDLDPLLPFRKNKIYLMPFENWQGTYYSLTNKDFKKVNFMPTQVFEISPDVMVGDMQLINRAHEATQPQAQAEILKKYMDSRVPYKDFVNNPEQFEFPELLAEPHQIVDKHARVKLGWDKHARKMVLDIVSKPLSENSGNPVHNAPLYEGRSTPVICVDVQPEYSGINDGAENPVFEEIIQFVNSQTGPVLMYVNAEDQGLTGDTVQDVKSYWEDTVRGEDADPEDYDDSPINWRRFQIVDKGYGYLRSWMDHGIPAATIIKTIRMMYQQKVNSSDDLTFPKLSQRTPEMVDIKHTIEEMDGDSITVNWISIAQLKRFNGAYIVGGGRNECLREVELLMNAFNIKYKRIDHLVYG
jgi:hypothetical protein